MVDEFLTHGRCAGRRFRPDPTRKPQPNRNTALRKATMRHHFEHNFEDDPARSDFDVNLDTPEGARIRVDSGEDGVWVSANREGWLHLARICAEMALHSRFPLGYHFHRRRDRDDAPPTEVSIELSE